MGVINQHPQLVKDQIGLKFQCGSQGLGNFQQGGLFVYAQSHSLLKLVFSGYPFAHIAQQCQRTVPALILECYCAPFDIEY